MELDVEVMQAKPSITYLTCMPEIELVRLANRAHDFSEVFALHSPFVHLRPLIFFVHLAG